MNSQLKQLLPIYLLFIPTLNVTVPAAESVHAALVKRFIVPLDEIALSAVIAVDAVNEIRSANVVPIAES
jgi:hypothetical protein